MIEGVTVKRKTTVRNSNVLLAANIESSETEKMNPSMNGGYSIQTMIEK